MRKIKLYSRKYPDKYAIVDNIDYNRINKIRWNYTKKGYAVKAKKNKSKTYLIYMHRLILKPKDGKVTDHINENKLDNRRANLRSVTRLENSWNITRKKVGNVGITGIRMIVNKYHAYLTIDGKVKHLGSYEKIEDAIKARSAWEIAIRGKFARPLIQLGRIDKYKQIV